MKLKKSLVAFAAVAALGMSMASAATVGVVNINTLAMKMPAFPAYAKSAQAVQAKYAPQLQVAQKEFQAAKTEAAKAAVQKKYAPVFEKYQAEEAKLAAPLEAQIKAALLNLEKEKKYDAILPLNLPADAAVQDATAAAIAAAK